MFSFVLEIKIKNQSLKRLLCLGFHLWSDESHDFNNKTIREFVKETLQPLQNTADDSKQYLTENFIYLGLGCHYHLLTLSNLADLIWDLTKFFKNEEIKNR